MGKRKSKRTKTLILPEAMIQHIQSFMSAEEAARSAILSKSWYNAWLTRPTVDLDDGNNFFFSKWPKAFEEFAKKTMQRYRDSSMKIESFRLRLRCGGYSRNHLPRNLIATAMEAGAIDLKLDLGWSSLTPFRLPQEVLGSKTLLRLSVCGSEIDGKHVSCSRLKCLSLFNVKITNEDEFRNIIISCRNSLEELSLSDVHWISFSPNELPKLRKLYLNRIYVDSMFFTDFASRFPCLKDLAIHSCYSWKRMHIATTSLQTISFKPSSYEESYVANFDVPNIRKFTYSGEGVPSHLSINGASREWELYLTIASYSTCGFLDLKKLLRGFRLSRICLFINPGYWKRLDPNDKYKVGTDVVETEPIVVENLVIDAHYSDCCALLLRLLAICRPEFITHDCTKKDTLAILYEVLMHEPISPNCGITNQNTFGRFGLKKVNMEVYEWYAKEWRPLVLEKPLDVTETPGNIRKIQFELIWD